MRGTYSSSSASASHSVSFTSTSKPNCSASPIDAGQLSNLNPDLGDASVGMTFGFLLHRLEDGSGYA